MLYSLVKGIRPTLAKKNGARIAFTTPRARYSTSVMGFDARGGTENDDDLQHEQLLNRYNLSAMNTEQVFVIQPFKRSHSSKYYRDAGIQMAESVALADTLGWKVVDKEIVGLPHFDFAEFFKWGKLQELAERVRRNATVSAVFLSTYQLRMTQRFVLEVGTLNMPGSDEFPFMPFPSCVPGSFRRACT